MAQIYFYDATSLDAQQLTEGLQETDHSWHFIEDKISTENVYEDAEVVSVFVTSTVTREMIEKMPRLRLIACRSTGFNNIDMQATAERDIAVVNVPTYGEATVAEYAFTMLLALTRRLPEVINTENTQFTTEQLLGTDLNGKTIGIVGTGHIGQHAIRIARGFSMHVLAYDAYPNEQLAAELGFRYVDLDTLLTESDIISLHVPLLPETEHLINAERLAQMKPRAILANTARGELVDTKALVDALSSGAIGGAVLDVIEGEVLLHHQEEVALLRRSEIDPAMMRHSLEISLLKKMPNVIISPHNAFNTVEAVGRINATTVRNIIDYWYGNTPNRIQPPKTKIGKLIVVRHAESEWNATGQWTGTRDIHLSEKGFREAAQLGRAFKENAIHIDLAFCSQQIRTRETLEGILDASGQFEVDIVREAAMNERDYGDYTGKNKWEMKELIGEEAWNAVRRGWDAPVPNGETLKTVYERVVPFYQETVVPLLLSGKNVLIVAHGNSIRALMKYLESISDEGVTDLEMLFGQIVTYTIKDDGLADNKSIITIHSEPPHA
jgi:D-lactate dehydrogenase